MNFRDVCEEGNLLGKDGIHVAGRIKCLVRVMPEGGAALIAQRLAALVRSSPGK